MNALMDFSNQTPGLIPLVDEDQIRIINQDHYAQFTALARQFCNEHGYELNQIKEMLEFSDLTPKKKLLTLGVEFIIWGNFWLRWAIQQEYICCFQVNPPI